MTVKKIKTLKKAVIIAVLIAAPCACIVISLFLGRYPIHYADVFPLIWGKISYGAEMTASIQSSVIWEIRLPRAFLGALVGASLAASGTALQGLFRNPLVSSGMLGVSSGAGFGAALAIIMFKSTAAIYICAFIFGIMAVILSYLVGKIYNSAPAIMLVLGGVIISSIFSAMISFLKFLADPYEDLPSIVFWLMGSLASVQGHDVLAAAIPMLGGIMGLMLIRWRINVLSMGEREAKTLGIHVNMNRAAVIIFTTIATAGAVCISGIIGWVGLVIPHMGRMIAGNDNRILMPVSISLGACFMVIIDNIARNISGGEIPLGILTSLIGGPFFIYLLRRTRGGGW